MKNSLKSKVRYWFLFLRLANEIRDPIVLGNLRKSESFYKTWGNYQTEAFESWWKKHSGLFREISTIRLLSSSEAVSDTEFVVSIPYSLSPTAVGKTIASMYRKKQSEKQTKKPAKSGKTKKVYGGQFALSSPEYQVAQFAYYYKFAKDVYVPSVNKGKLRNRELLDTAKSVFSGLKRKTTTVRDIPFTKTDSSPDAESKQIRRYRQYAEKLLMNVSLGVFPGEYELKPKTTAVQLKLELTEKRKIQKSGIKQKRRARHSTDAKIIKRPNPLDPHSVRKKRKDAGVKRTKSSK